MKPLACSEQRKKSNNIIKELTRSSWGWLCSRFPQRRESGWRGEAGGRWPPPGAAAAHPSARTWTSSRALPRPSRSAASNSSAPCLTLTASWNPDQEKLSPLDWKEVIAIERASQCAYRNQNRGGNPNRTGTGGVRGAIAFSYQHRNGPPKKGCKRAFLLSLRHCIPPIGKQGKEMLGAKKRCRLSTRKRDAFSCFFLFPPFFREGCSS